MKRRISLILCLVLCLTAFTAPAYAFRITKAQKAYAMGGGEALWELVNTHYDNSLYLEKGYADLYIWQPDGPAFVCFDSDEYQPQTIYKVNMRETAGVGFTLEQVLTYTVTAWLDCSRLMSTLRRIEPFVRGNISMAFSTSK